MIPPHKTKLDSKNLAAILSSLISQLLLLLHLFPSTTSSSTPLLANSNSLLLHHLLSSSLLISYFLSRKRKRPNSPESTHPNLTSCSSTRVKSPKRILTYFPKSPPPPGLGGQNSIHPQLARVNSPNSPDSPVTRKRKHTHFPKPDSPPELGPQNSTPPPSVRVDPPPESTAILRNPDNFKQHFMMTSATFEWLSSLLEPLLECRDPVNSPINLPAELRLGIGLYHLATGSNYPEISTRFGVSEPVCRFCVKQLCRVLCNNFRFWVGYPNSNELDQVSSSFESLTGLPNCCGVLNCTRFNIKRISNNNNNDIDVNVKENENDKFVAAQILVDSSSRILSIVAGFRGEKGNFVILKSSSLYKDIVEYKKVLNSENVYVDSVSVPPYIVGVSGYPLLPWLMVPFVEPMTDSCEDNFNVLCDLMSVAGRRTIGSLRKWGVLSRPIEGEVKTAVAYIGACSILHNCLLMREDSSGLCDDLADSSSTDDTYGSVGLEENLVENKGVEIRNALARRAKEVGKTSVSFNTSHKLSTIL